MCWQLFIFYICPDCDLPVLSIAIGVVNRYAKEVKVFEQRWGDPDCGVLFSVSTPARERRTEVRSPMSFFYEDINAVNESTILMASSNLHYLQKNPSPDTSMLLVRASTCGFEGHNSVRSCIYSRKCGKYR